MKSRLFSEADDRDSGPEKNLLQQKHGEDNMDACLTAVYKEDNTYGYKRDIRSFSSDDHYSDNSEYQCRESTPSTDSTQELAVVKPPKSKKDCLISTNKHDIINLDSFDQKWTLKNGYELSNSFLKRRNELVNSCSDCNTSLKQDEELAINGILLLDDNVSSNLIGVDNYEEVCIEAKRIYSKYEEDDSYNKHIVRFAQLMSKGEFTKAENELTRSSLPIHILTILYPL